jgi:hypothetical protein
MDTLKMVIKMLQHQNQSTDIKLQQWNPFFIGPDLFVPRKIEKDVCIRRTGRKRLRTYTWNCSLSHNCDTKTLYILAYQLLIYSKHLTLSTSQYWQCNVQINVMGSHYLVLKFPDNGTLVPEHVAVFYIHVTVHRDKFPYNKTN